MRQARKWLKERCRCGGKILINQRFGAYQHEICVKCGNSYTTSFDRPDWIEITIREAAALWYSELEFCLNERMTEECERCVTADDFEQFYRLRFPVLEMSRGIDPYLEGAWHGTNGSWGSSLCLFDLLEVLMPSLKESGDSALMIFGRLLSYGSYECCNGYGIYHDSAEEFAA